MSHLSLCLFPGLKRDEGMPAGLESLLGPDLCLRAPGIMDGPEAVKSQHNMLGNHLPLFAFSCKKE